MAQDRSTRALARIEAALARIESAPPPAGGEDAGQLARLEQRHAALRAAVETQIGQLDLLIGEQPR